MSTQKLAKIKKITAKCGADGTVVRLTVTSDDGSSEDWAGTAVMLDNRVLVMQMGVDNAPVYELEKQGRDLRLTQTTD